jgi:integrase
VAAFTGLARSELKGLKWEDYDGETINVRRKIWNDHVGAPKTEAREAGVYVVPLLRKILAKYKASYPSVGEGWIFRGEKMLRPLDLDNLSRRDIPQYINGAWFGWHAFRGGLGTKLNEAESMTLRFRASFDTPTFQPRKHSIFCRIGNGPRRG